MKVWNEIFNRNNISCIIGNTIHFSDGTKVHKNQPFMDFKKHLKGNMKKHYCVVFDTDGNIVWNSERETKNKTAGRIPNYYLSFPGYKVETTEYKIVNNEIQVLDQRLTTVPRLR